MVIGGLLRLNLPCIFLIVKSIRKKTIIKTDWGVVGRKVGQTTAQRLIPSFVNPNQIFYKLYSFSCRKNTLTSVLNKNIFIRTFI